MSDLNTLQDLDRLADANGEESAAQSFRRQFLALAQASSSGPASAPENATIHPVLIMKPTFPDLTEDNPSSPGAPLFRKPSAPCDYCRSKQMECYIICEARDDDCGCAPCRSLFRSCSLRKSAINQRASPRHLDTLHMVPEDLVQDQGGMTGTKPLLSTGASFYDVLDDLTQRRPDKAVTRFSRCTTQILKNWLQEHREHPYPNEDEKNALKEQTGLTQSQITNWLANARRRSKIRSRRGESPPTEWMQGSKPIRIAQHQDQDQSYMTPLERWKESPPEHEPAPFTAIARAVAHSDFPEQDSGGSSQTQSQTGIRSSSGSNLSMFRAPSSTSLDTGRSSGSRNSFGSGRLSHGSRSSYGSFAKKERHRRRRTVPIATRPSVGADRKSRKFHCTFCTDTFHTKYDWTRHEKSLHLSLEQWTCAPQGPVVKSANGTFPVCVYCRHSNPTPDHLATHNYSACEEKGLSARTFYRKDHLRQHLRLVHNVNLHPSMEAWKSTYDSVRSRCGFCPPDKPTNFTSWSERADHLSKHFHSGCTMADWRGEHGFECDVAALVSHAMPPYMIAMDSRTPLPFSATQRTTWSNTWDEPTRRLGDWVRQRQAEGHEVSDDELKGQARALVFGEADEWNTSRADHPEWLAAFKRTYGLETTQGSGTGTRKEQISYDDPMLGYSFATDGPDPSTLATLSDPTLWSSHLYNNAPDFPQPSCYQLEAMELSAYINARKAEGRIHITDHELQEHARLGIYGTTEAWDFTAADNPEWLRGLRAAHGLPDESQAHQVENKGASSLPTPMEDLGMSLEGASTDVLAGGAPLDAGMGDMDGFWDPNLGLDLDEELLDLNLESGDAGGGMQS